MNLALGGDQGPGLVRPGDPSWAAPLQEVLHLDLATQLEAHLSWLKSELSLLERMGEQAYIAGRS